MTKKAFFAILLLAGLYVSAFSISLGLTGGTISNSNELTYGLSSDMSLLLPMVKLELELGLLTDIGDNIFSGGVKFRPKLGKISPYGIIGIAVEFNKFGFDFDEYKWSTFFGAGLHYYFIDMFSLRFDMRLYSFSVANRVRITGGVYLHL